MSEKTYTKGDLMAALNRMKEPQEGDFDLPHCKLNDTKEGKAIFIGAELLIEAVTEGVANPRELVNKRLREWIICEAKADIARGLQKALDGLLGASDVVSEAERVTAPPQGR